MAEGLTLYTCHIDSGGPKLHPCRQVHEALDAAGHTYETVVFDKNKPFGLFTKGKRPKLQEMSGQEKLPVLALADGTTISGSGEIKAWARDSSPAA
jgi:glutathione S-transferase